MTEHYYEYRPKLTHCDLCGVRTYCRVLDGVKICPDRCWPSTQMDCGMLMQQIDWWTRWCNAPRWQSMVEDYNSLRGDEVRCINCDRRIVFSQQDNAWVHWAVNRLECQPTTYAQPPTNYRP